MREIIMSQGQDLHISSIFIKGETIFLPFVISTMRVGLDVWMKEKKNTILIISKSRFLWFIDYI